jgi:hypothetical protein
MNAIGFIGVSREHAEQTKKPSHSSSHSCMYRNTAYELRALSVLHCSFVPEG